MSPRSRALAEDAIDVIEVDIAQLDPVPDWRASKTDQTVLFEEIKTNLACHYTTGIGDADSAIAGADYVRRESFRAHRHTAVPMETPV